MAATAGRKRSFELGDALDAAMRVFWQKGYAGASLTDLTAAMGINKPSLYAAYGNKEALFIQATDHYLNHHARPVMDHLTAEDVPLKQRLTNYLDAIIRQQADCSQPAGCMIAQCVSEAANNDMPEQAAEAVRKVQTFSEAWLVDFFGREKRSGALGANADPAYLALLFTTLINGTSQLSRSGKPVEEILTLIEPTLAQLPLID